VELGGNYPPLPPITQHTGSFYFSSPTRPVASPRPFLSCAASFHVNSAAAGALPSTGRLAGPPESPEMSRPPPPLPPPLNSGRRVGLSRPPPPTLDALDGNGAAAAGDEEQNGAHGAVWEDSFAPFSEGFDAASDFGEEEAGGLGTGAADGLPRSASGLALGAAGGLGRGAASGLAGGLARGTTGLVKGPWCRLEGGGVNRWRPN
jgi:hypothetical protein